MITMYLVIRTNTSEVFTPEQSPLVLVKDGTNVLRWDHKCVITDKLICSRNMLPQVVFVYSNFIFLIAYTGLLLWNFGVFFSSIGGVLVLLFSLLVLALILRKAGQMVFYTTMGMRMNFTVNESKSYIRAMPDTADTSVADTHRTRKYKTKLLSNILTFLGLDKKYEEFYVVDRTDRRIQQNEQFKIEEYFKMNFSQKNK